MPDFTTQPEGADSKRVVVFAAVVAVAGILGAYALHEHHTAESLAADNVQTTAALNATEHQLGDLSEKVNQMAVRSQEQEAQARAQAAQEAAARTTASGRAGTTRTRAEDSHFKKLQSQLDDQGKAIAQAQSDLTSTQGDLSSTRTELTGSIAHTHDELVLLQKRGERNYAEFDLSKSKQFQRAGAVEIRLRKANDKHQYADMDLMVDDRNLSQKHANLYQPVMFYTPDSPQPVEVVINSIGKDHIHGYVSAPKYRQSELVSMANAGQDANSTGQAPANGNAQPSPRQKLPMPQ
jgi:hypothetical protein